MSGVKNGAKRWVAGILLASALVAGPMTTSVMATAGDSSGGDTTPAPPPAGPATSSSTSTSTSSTTSTTSSTTSTTSSTTSTTTTTVVPPRIADANTPGRRGKGTQVGATLPPPTTTTTTTTTTLAPDALPPNSGEGRRVVYSKSQMRVWATDDAGRVVKTHRVSGRRTWNQPSPGSYQVFSRSSYTCNIKSQHICWRYMVRFTVGPGGDNIGFHQIPVNTRTGYPVQSISQLGQALSGGCVRQAPSDAAWMWNFGYIGTRVVVLG